MATKYFEDGEWKVPEIGTIKGKRTVAFIDILGFKNLIKNNKLSDLAKKYEDAVFEINLANKAREYEERPRLFKEHPIDIPFCKTYIFSDSVIIISNGPSEIECLKTLIVAWRTLQQFIIRGLTARGAVTHGEIYINEKNNIFIGKALTDAYELEQIQEWVGAVIDSSVFNEFPELLKNVQTDTNFYSKLFLKYNVPFKKGITKEYYTLNWRANLMLEKGAKALFRYTGDTTVDIKFDNTLEYNKIAKHYSKTDETPVELHNYWLGQSKPPFKDPD